MRSPVPCHGARTIRRPIALPRARRHPRRPPAGVGAVDGAGRRRSPTRAGRYGFDLVITPIFEHLEVFQRVGGVHRRRPQGDVRLRGQGRPAHRAAARGHRRGGAGVRASTARWSRGRSGTSRRTSATSGRRRAATASTCRWAPRRSGVDDPQLDVEVIALAHGFYRALGLRDFTLSINSMGDDADRAEYVEVLRAYLLAPRRRPRRRVPRARRRQPAAGARLEGPRLAGRHRARAADHRVPG